MQPSEVAVLLRRAREAVRLLAEGLPRGHEDVAALHRLADSFDQPGPLAYDETEGVMVRLEPWLTFPPEVPQQELWRFPASAPGALEAEQ